MFTLHKPVENEDYDDSNDNDFVARLIENNPLDNVTHLLNQKIQTITLTVTPPFCPAQVSLLVATKLL